MPSTLKRLALVVAFIFSTGLLAACSEPPGDMPNTLTDSEAVPVTMTVYKSPTCGCCTLWVDHLEQNGFDVTTTEMPNVMPVKQQLGVPARFVSCHTGVVDGYVVEGHVPADVIRRLLDERPEIAGVAVAGMPVGSPGMDGPNPQPYDVMAFTKNGHEYVFASR